MADPVFNPTPKQSFQADKRAMKAHLDLIARQDLNFCLNTALMEYQLRLVKASANLNDAASNHFKISGAIEFLDEFKKLSLQHVPATRKVEGQLIQT